MSSTSYAHRPFHSLCSEDITSEMTLQMHATDEVNLPDEKGTFVSMKTFSLDTYKKEEIFVTIDQLTSTRHSLRHIE